MTQIQLEHTRKLTFIPEKKSSGLLVPTAGDGSESGMAVGKEMPAANHEFGSKPLPHIQFKKYASGLWSVFSTIVRYTFKCIYSIYLLYAYIHTPSDGDVLIQPLLPIAENLFIRRGKSAEESIRHSIFDYQSGDSAKPLPLRLQPLLPGSNSSPMTTVSLQPSPRSVTTTASSWTTRRGMRMKRSKTRRIPSFWLMGKTQPLRIPCPR